MVLQRTDHETFTETSSQRIASDIRRIGPKPEGVSMSAWNTRPRHKPPRYLIGVGIAEVTGPSNDRLRLTSDGLELLGKMKGLQGSALTNVVRDWHAGHGGPRRRPNPFLPPVDVDNDR
jgi:hypothetical protein